VAQVSQNEPYITHKRSLNSLQKRPTHVFAALSTVPQEEEVLYPPLTYLRPISVQRLSSEKGKDSRGQVVLVKPSFPS
jgi:hypothetical protein